jgi:phosphoglycolate phosphatase-like HAD superfamily hydrolase
MIISNTNGFRLFYTCLFLVLVVGCAACYAKNQPDSLRSWNDGPAKTGIVDFVAKVTAEGSPDYVLPAERIAVFDNDGTLWVEQPVYTQLAFAIDRIKILAAQHPEWETTQPFKAAIENDMDALAASGHQGLFQLIAASHADMTSAEFERIVADWLATAKHPTYKKLYTQLVYQPMLELLKYLRSNGFKTFIVSGGGQAFMRPFTEKVYGIPPEQVIGSRINTQFKWRDGQPVLLRLPEVNFINDKAGKPVGIYQHIGRRPIAAFGNSDGDLQMLQWTTAGKGPRLALIVHHTDAKREWAYDRQSPVGKLDQALDQAQKKGWIVVDMKKDWNVIFPF